MLLFNLKKEIFLLFLVDKIFTVTNSDIQGVFKICFPIFWFLEMNVYQELSIKNF
jgi:hypothetical protein